MLAVLLVVVADPTADVDVEVVVACLPVVVVDGFPVVVVGFPVVVVGFPVVVVVGFPVVGVEDFPLAPVVAGEFPLLVVLVRAAARCDCVLSPATDLVGLALSAV